MGKRDETLTFLRSGISPGAIRRIQGVTLSTILGYLDELIGRGRLRRSDIFFSVPLQVRHALFNLISGKKQLSRDSRRLARRLTSLGVEADPDDIEVALRYRAEQFAFGDMYESIRAIETGLHRLVREVLEGEHGIGEKGWWRKSVPLSIRQKCVDRREEDEEPADDPYAYTDLLDLARIAEKEWQTVSARLPKDAAANRKRFVQDLERMNRIRRMVMHPVRGLFPSEDDFQFVHDLERKLGLNK